MSLLKRLSSGWCGQPPARESELAARVGTVRELISRNLGRLHGDGLIEMRRRNVRIPNVQRLEDELGSRD